MMFLMYKSFKDLNHQKLYILQNYILGFEKLISILFIIINMYNRKIL